VILALLIFVAFAAVVILVGCWRALRRTVDKHGLHVLIWRYATGAHMTHGRTHACVPGAQCRAGRWAHARRHHRAGVRLAVLAFTLACGYGWLADRGALAVALIAGGAASIAAAAVWAWRSATGRKHHRVIVTPMVAALARTLPAPETDVRRMLALPAASMRRTRGELGTLTLPDWYAASPDQRKAVDHLLSSHWPGDVDTTWHTAGAPKRVVISAAPSPPDDVPFEMVRGQIERLKPGQVLLGLDRRSDPYLGDFNGGDDPHWGFSVGSGRGKSTQLCSIGAQILHQDPAAAMLGVDPKMTSFEALSGVPGVELANDPRDIPGMWAAIGRYKTRMEERIAAKKADPTLEFPVYLLFLDEINQFAAMSLAHWKNEMDEKGTPPVWLDIAAVFWMGRFVHCHAVAVGQRLDDKATGGIGLRDSLGLRGLAGFRPNQWKMLVGTTPIPKSQKPRGRWIYSDGQDETWVQNVLMTPAEARAWAMAGRTHHPAGTSGPVSVRPALTSIAGGNTDGHPAPAGTVWVVGLQAAADHLGMTLAAFEKARQRRPVDGEMRRGSQPAWSDGDLNEWAANRPRAGAAVGE
jgi:hypothetical protein